MSEDRHTPRRRAVLDALRTAAQPLGVADIAAGLGIHPNTARFHLDALVADGSVERELAQPAGRGRPRTVYRPRSGMDRGGVRAYLLLARILLSRMAAAGPDSGAQAAEAGRGWGRYLVAPVPPFERPTAQQATGRLTALLADLGFEPEAEGTRGDTPGRIRLRHCPFLELAEEYGSVVCPLHFGLIQGALAELRAPVAAARLEPFAEPGACLVHLAPARAA